jgi:FkbM family methyltransferase
MGNEKKIIEPFLGKMGPGDTVFDIGASVGLYTVFIAKTVGKHGRVVAFEPERRSRQRLEENIRLNSLDNVLVVSDALGRERSRQFLKPDKDFASGANVIFKDKKDPEAAGGEEISVVSGDAFIKERALPVPNALKIDVEGMEDDVLAGLKETLRKPECRTVLCEVHFSNLEKRGKPEAPKHIEEILKASGFGRLLWLDRSHLLAVK